MFPRSCTPFYISFSNLHCFTLRQQINVHAFSGAQATREEQEKYGANCEVDVSYQYLKFFLDDDEKLAEIHRVSYGYYLIYYVLK